MNNYKERFKTVELEDLKHPQNAKFSLGEYPDEKVTIPASRYEIEDCFLNVAEEYLKFYNITVNETSKHLLVLIFERKDKKFFLSTVETPHKSRNFFLILLNKNIWKSKKSRTEEDYKKYSMFYENIDRYNLKYKDVVRFVKELQKCKAFLVIKGSFFTKSATKISYIANFKNDEFFKVPKNCDDFTFYKKMGQCILMFCFQENLKHLIQHWENSAEILMEQDRLDDFVKIKGKQNHLSNKAWNDQVEFKKMNKLFEKVDRELKCKFFTYTRVYREGALKGGRIYNGITQFPKELRKIIFEMYGLTEIDLSSAQMQYLDFVSYKKEFSDRDMYEDIFNNMQSVKKYKKYYKELRPFIKLGCSVMVNKSSATTYILNNELVRLGLIYSNEEVSKRRKLIEELKSKYENPYTAQEYLNFLKAIKGKRLERIKQSKSEKIVKSLKYVPQKVLKAMIYDFVKTFNLLYPSYFIKQISGKYELPESNSVIEMINSNSNVKFAIHDCLVVKTNSNLEKIKNEFFDKLKNEFTRYKKNIISFSYKKIINLKKAKFKKVKLKLTTGGISLPIYNIFPNDKIVLIS